MYTLPILGKHCHTKYSQKKPFIQIYCQCALVCTYALIILAIYWDYKFFQTHIDLIITHINASFLKYVPTLDYEYRQ